MNVRLTATMALNGSPTDSLSARAPGTADTVDTMDGGSGISMTAGAITTDVVDSAAILDTEVTEERVSAANVVGVAILVNAASEAASVASTAANLTAEVSAAKWRTSVKFGSARNLKREQFKRPAAKVAGRFLFEKILRPKKSRGSPLATNHWLPQYPDLHAMKSAVTVLSSVWALVCARQKRVRAPLGARQKT